MLPRSIPSDSPRSPIQPLRCLARMPDAYACLEFDVNVPQGMTFASRRRNPRLQWVSARPEVLEHGAPGAGQGCAMSDSSCECTPPGVLLLQRRGTNRRVWSTRTYTTRPIFLPSWNPWVAPSLSPWSSRPTWIDRSVWSSGPGHFLPALRLGPSEHFG